MWTDQPIRVLAVFVLAPILVYKGIGYGDWFIIAYGIALFAWDLFCILYKAPVQLEVQRTASK